MSGLFGVLLAVAAALVLSLLTVTIRVGTDSGESSDAMLVILAVNLVVLLPLAVSTGAPLGATSPVSVAAFVAAGLTGTLVGRAFFYAGIESIGASRAEPMKGAMPLCATLIAVVVLEEPLSAGNLVGVLAIVAGVALISREIATTHAAVSNDVGIELVFPLVAAMAYGIEPIFAKLGFAEGTTVVTGLLIKTGAATIGFLGYLLWRRNGSRAARILPARNRWFLAAGILNTGFLLLYYTALTVAPVVLVVPIVQTSPLFVLVLSVLFLQRRERVTRQLAAGAVVVVVGAVLVTLYG
jgi:DME family drug/metabolite transporter